LAAPDVVQARSVPNEAHAKLAQTFMGAPPQKEKKLEET
jgi:hypothetical protein